MIFAPNGKGQGAHTCIGTNQMPGGDVTDGRGIWSLANPVVGCGRDETLALLRQAANRNDVWAPNPIPCQRRGGGRGLGSLLPANPSSKSSESGYEADSDLTPPLLSHDIITNITT